ncbi:helix-turn-helix domain-containing GNAT family N-acetyltransferase [Agromyces sp. G08B096]|uniref:Helix-turn-helix domain-containing GNAT family N-acetyltransferase n=1 Tax=Agromyces sp. G08B096 TaxID=3156399 RepID=A0AAU7WB14_9MICO
MDDIARVRRFNRTVTERVGALDDHYLARGRPLGQSRLIWEIGGADASGADVREQGVELRALRARLGLDAGYLSRQLRALEREGLVEVATLPGDTRVRVARLTDSGAAEVAELDRLSDELVEGMLAPLTAGQRERLVRAMDEVRLLLAASSVEIAVTDPREASARFCIAAYFEELQSRFDAGFDPQVTRTTTDAMFSDPHGAFLVATLHGEPVGCIGLMLHGDDPAEIKRLWVAPSARGMGLGRRLLAAVEEEAARRGATTVRLDTNRALVEAIALYRATGYREIDDFNGEPYADFWFEKPLGGAA